MDPSTATLALAGINVLVAMSLAYPLSCGVVSLASGAFMGIGMFATPILVSDAGPFWPLSLPAAGAIAALVALPVGLMVARLPASLATVTTLALTLGVAGVLAGQPVSGPIDRSQVPMSVSLLLLMATLVLATYTALQAQRARFGRALLISRSDPTLAASLGIDVARNKCLAFVLSAGIAGMAGAVGALLGVGGSGAHASLQASVTGLEGTVIGGIAAGWGPWLGALVLSFLPLFVQLAPLGRAGVPNAAVLVGSTSFIPIAGGFVTLLILLAAPRGISGSAKRWRQRQRSLAGARRALVVPDTHVAPAASLVELRADKDQVALPDRDDEQTPSTDADEVVIDRPPSEPPYQAAAS